MLEEPAAENLHGGIREGGDRLESWPTYTRTKLETAERRQGTPKTQGGLLYSDCAGFPLSHSPGDGWLSCQTGHIMCYKNRTF